MDFSLDQTQERWRRSSWACWPEHTDPADTGGFSPELWQALAKADLLSLAVPERLGGDGLGVLEVATMLTEIGRGAAPVPALATLGFGVLPVLALGSAQQQTRCSTASRAGAC